MAIVQLETSLEHLTRAVDQHLWDVSNQLYTDSVRQRMDELRKLFVSGSGEVSGLIMSWMPDIQPVIEVVFGEDMSGRAIGEHKEYGPTVFPGILARTRIVSVDEIFGPTVSLDLTAFSPETRAEAA